MRVLVQQLVEADEDVVPTDWEAAYRRVRAPMAGYARRRLGAAAAEDAVHETLSRALRGGSRPAAARYGLDAWLWGILRNVVREMARDALRRSHDGEAEDRPCPLAGPLERVVDAEERRHVRLAFERLAESDRELLELRLVARLSTPAVASLLGRGEGAVRMAQSRALRRLRGHLEAVTAG